MRTRIAATAVILAWGITDVGHAAPPTTAPTAIQAPVIQIEDIIGVDGGTKDPLPALAHAVASDGVQGLPQLVDAVLAGDPLALRKATMAHTTLHTPGSERQSDAKRSSWKYGTSRSRDELCKLIWSAAKGLAGTDPQNARRYARAAITLKAMDDFPFGIYQINSFIRDSKGMAAAELSPEQIVRLKAFVDSRVTDQVDYLRKAGLAVDRLFKHPQPAEFTSAIKAMNAWPAEQVPEPGAPLDFARYAQQLLNHAVASGDPAVLQKVTSAVKSWRDAAKGDFRRWLGEALTERGKPTRVYDLMVFENGKFVETDSDGNAP